jgi:hypothetical protein
LSKNVTGIDAGKYWPPKKLDDDEFWEDAKEPLGAIFTPNGGYIDDPLLATENLAQAAISAGVKFSFKSKITAILKEGNKVTGVEVDGNEKILADIVINAGGPWSNRINGEGFHNLGKANAPGSSSDKYSDEFDSWAHSRRFRSWDLYEIYANRINSYWWNRTRV